MSRWYLSHFRDPIQHIAKDPDEKGGRMTALCGVAVDLFWGSVGYPAVGGKAICEDCLPPYVTSDARSAEVKE